MDNKCSICWENIVNINSTITICKHMFHATCLHEWMKIKRNCPMCRTRIIPNRQDGQSLITDFYSTNRINNPVRELGIYYDDGETILFDYLDYEGEI